MQNTPFFLLPSLLPCCCLPIAGILGLALFAFWIWMIIDCATNEPDTPGSNTKIMWILIIILTNWVGAAIYYLVRRPERKRTSGK